WNGHWEGDPQPYRTKEEIEQWKLKCPIVGFKKHLLDNKILTEEDFVQIEKEVEDNMEQAIEFARKSPFPKAEEALEDIYTV
ncbi:MAG: thiamine pyrophosphate-dependent enzyme, partial [Desulfobacterales bacterium]